MGCDDYPIIGEHYEIIGDGPIAIGWNPQLAELFPNADHVGCRQQMWVDGDHWQPFDPPKCVDYHCPRCGTACNVFGHHNCTKPPHQENQP